MIVVTEDTPDEARLALDLANAMVVWPRRGERQDQHDRPCLRC